MLNKLLHLKYSIEKLENEIHDLTMSETKMRLILLHKYIDHIIDDHADRILQYQEFQKKQKT